MGPPIGDRDSVAWVVTGVGVAALGAGGALYMNASSVRDDAEREVDLDDRDDGIERANTLRRFGTGLLIGGAGVAVVGAVLLWRNPAARANSTAQSRLRPDVHVAGDGFVVGLSGGF
ncbi:MAG: hypothetical protein AAGC55_20295 [Myxococcota bacterium]